MPASANSRTAKASRSKLPLANPCKKQAHVRHAWFMTSDQPALGLQVGRRDSGQLRVEESLLLPGKVAVRSGDDNAVCSGDDGGSPSCSSTTSTPILPARVVTLSRPRRMQPGWSKPPRTKFNSKHNGECGGLEQLVRTCQAPVKLTWYAESKKGSSCRWWMTERMPSHCSGVGSTPVGL